MISISSNRLKLVPLDNSLLKIWQNEGRQALEKALHLKPNNLSLEPFFEQEMKDALANFWLPMTHKFPLDFTWYTNWEIILTDSSCSIGGIGLSGLPDNHGSTEIGYAIDQKFRNLGYAAEALETLVNWAFQDPDLNYIRAETPVENRASQSVLQRTLFHQTGQKTIQCPEPLEVFTWECTR
jgi:ribosomal-protein-alanine N-acetyltransferase